jgi:DNA-binding MarR family transcriptional regulator
MDCLALPKEKCLQDLASRYPQIDLSSLQLYLLFINVSSELSFAREAHFGRYELSPGRFTLLMLLLEGPKEGVSPSELAKMSAVSGATITGLLDGLENAGLVRRIENVSDRRATLAQLTPKGRAHLEKILPDHFARLMKLMKDLSKPEKKTLIACLNKIQKQIPALRDP